MEDQSNYQEMGELRREVVAYYADKMQLLDGVFNTPNRSQKSISAYRLEQEIKGFFANEAALADGTDTRSRHRLDEYLRRKEVKGVQPRELGRYLADTFAKGKEEFDGIDAAIVYTLLVKQYLDHSNAGNETAVSRMGDLMYPCAARLAEKVGETNFRLLDMPRAEKIITKLLRSKLPDDTTEIFESAFGDYRNLFNVLVKRGIDQVAFTSSERKEVRSETAQLSNELKKAREYGSKPIVIKGEDIRLPEYDIIMAPPYFMVHYEKLPGSPDPMVDFLFVEPKESHEPTVEINDQTIRLADESPRGRFRLFSDGTVDICSRFTGYPNQPIDVSMGRYQNGDPALYLKWLLTTLAYDAFAPATVIESDAVGGSVPKVMKEAAPQEPIRQLMRRITIPRIKSLSGPNIKAQWHKIERGDDDEQTYHRFTSHSRILVNGQNRSGGALERYLAYIERTGVRFPPEIDADIRAGRRTFVTPRRPETSREEEPGALRVARLGEGATRRVLDATKPGDD